MNFPVYLINLSKDTDRLDAMRQHLSALGVPFERFEGVHGVELPFWLRPFFLNQDGSIASDLRKGEIGCYASHLALMARIAQEDTPAFVLEDDVEISPDFPEIMQFLPLPADWDIVRLSNHYRKGFLSSGAIAGTRYSIGKFCRVPPSTGAYLIHPDGARKFLSWKRERRLPVDQDMRRVWDCNLKTYGIYPRPIRPDVGESTIAKMDSRAIVTRGYRHRKTDKIHDVIYSIRWLGLLGFIKSMLRLAPREGKLTCGGIY